MDPNSTLLKARARALLQVAVRSTASTAAVAEPKAVEKKIWIRDPLLMGKNDSEVGWVAC